MLIDKPMNNVPSDWREPDWDKLNKCHCWKRYVDDEVQALWLDMSLIQRLALALNFNGLVENMENKN
jgi:hypothetical protein